METRDETATLVAAFEVRTQKRLYKGAAYKDREWWSGRVDAFKALSPVAMAFGHPPLNAERRWIFPGYGSEQSALEAVEAWLKVQTDPTTWNGGMTPARRDILNRGVVVSTSSWLPPIGAREVKVTWATAPPN